MAVRPASHVEPAGDKGIWPAARQGFQRVSSADTKEGWDKFKRQWIKHETTFEAPADLVRARAHSRGRGARARQERAGRAWLLLLNAAAVSASAAHR